MTLRQIRQALYVILGLMLVLSGVTYSSLLQRGYVVVKFSAVLIGATALLSLLTYGLSVGRRWRELRDPLVYLLGAELGVLGLSVAFSGQRWVSLLGSMPRLMGAITVASFVVAAVALVVAVGDRRERLIPLLRLVAVTTGVAGLEAIYEWPSSPIFRPPGLVGNAEFLSNYLLFGALGGVALLLVDRDHRWARLTALSTAMATVGMAVIRTRGAWLGYGAGVAALLIFINPLRVSETLLARGRRHLGWLALFTTGVAVLAAAWGYATASHPIGWNLALPFLPAAAVAMLALPWFLAPLPGVRHALLGLIAAATLVAGYAVTTQRAVLPYKVAEALRLTQESARGVVRNDTVRMLKKYWLLGCGIENFRVAFLEFKSERLARADPRVNYRNPHNMPLYEWTTNGLPGILVYLGLLGVAVVWLLRARRRGRHGAWALFATGILATLVGYTVQNLFNYDVIPTGLHYYVFLAMAVVLHRAAARDARPEDAGPEDASSSDSAPSTDAGAPSSEEPRAADAPPGAPPASQDKAGSAKTPAKSASTKTPSKSASAKTPSKSVRSKAAKSKKGKGKASRKKGRDGKTGQARSDAQQDRAKGSDKGARKQRAREAATEERQRETLARRQATWLLVGLAGALALYTLLYVVPPVRDLFRFLPMRDLPARGDTLGILAVLGAGGAGLGAGLLSPSPVIRRNRLLVGLASLAALVALFYAIPTVRDWLTKDPPAEAVHVKNDILPAILVLCWAGAWLILALSANLFDPQAGAAPVQLAPHAPLGGSGHGTPDGSASAGSAPAGSAPAAEPAASAEAAERETDASLQRSAWSLALLVLLLVGAGSWWAGRNLTADYALYRARALAGATARHYGSSVQRYDRAIQKLRAMLRQAERQGETRKASRIRQRLDRIRVALRGRTTRLGDALRQVRRYGRAAAHAVDVLGYYHFQYSKALHPFLKLRSVLGRKTFRSLVGESLSEARRGVLQNTNPESAWSHLAVVHLAAGDLAGAKRALARSIQYDPYYYDTHRMMALLHLQDGHIDEAVREMDRSLDITEGKHFVNTQSALGDFLKAARQGDWQAADRARARVWYWVERGRNFPGLPVQLLFWLRNFEWWTRAQRIAAALAEGRARRALALLAQETRHPPVLRMPGHHANLLRGLAQGLAGHRKRAVRSLKRVRPPISRAETLFARYVDVLSGLASVLPRLRSVLSPRKGDRPAQLQRRRVQVAGDMIAREHLYLRTLSALLVSHLRAEGGGDEDTRLRNTAALLETVYRRHPKDLYSQNFRRRYRQVLQARPRVLAAATPTGRMSYVRRFLRQQRLDAALLVADQLLARYPDKGAEANYFRGAILERQGRPEAARQAYEAYLEARPKGANAARASEALQRLGQPDPPTTP